MRPTWWTICSIRFVCRFKVVRHPLLRNDVTGDHHGIKIKLSGVKSNRGAMGAHYRFSSRRAGPALVPRLIVALDTQRDRYRSAGARRAGT
jgi:hypothetical protein